MHRMILITLLSSSEIIITAAAVRVAAIERSVVAIVIQLESVVVEDLAQARSLQSSDTCLSLGGREGV